MSSLFDPIPITMRSGDIIRDQDGHFRHPNGYPLVVIFDSKNEQEKPFYETCWQEPILGLPTKGPDEAITGSISSPPRKSKTSPQTIKFVNTFKPASSDRITKPNQSHVTSKLQSRKWKDKGYLEKFPEVESALTPCKAVVSSKPQNLTALDTFLPRQLFVSLDPFSTFPINMEPYMYTLLHRYISIILNRPKPPHQEKQQDLAPPRWLSLAMTDAALFHSLLCGSALYMDTLAGRKESLETSKHMKEAVCLLSKRLQEPESGLSESTLVAVAHLADFECMAGNFKNWNLHMDGLQKMVQLRGGFITLNSSLRTKIFRADLAGCIGTFSTPRFATEFPPPFPALTQPLPPSFTTTFALDKDLLALLLATQNLTSTLNTTPPHPHGTDHEIASLQYALLTLYFAPLTPGFQRACCVSVIAFLRTIHHYYRCLRIGDFVVGPEADGVLIGELRECVDMVDRDDVQPREFVLWMLFTGGILVSGNRRERAWFTAKMGRLGVEMGIMDAGWDGVKEKLMEYLWVDTVHEKVGKEMWEEAVVVGSVFSG